MPTEASVGSEYIRRQGVKAKILEESESRSTVENILFSKEVITRFYFKPSQIFVITSRNRERRIAFLYKRLYPESSRIAVFYSAPNGYRMPDILGALFPLKELILFIYQLFDTSERGWLAMLTKRIFRNSAPALVLARDRKDREA